MSPISETEPRSANPPDSPPSRPTERQLSAADCLPSYSRYLGEVCRDMRLNLQDILKLVELSLDSGLARTQRQYLRNIRTSTLNLLGQVEGLLDIARLQVGELDLDQIPFNPAVLFAELANTLAAHAQSRGHRIRCELAGDLPSYSQGDPGRIRQVLTNLLLLLLSGSSGEDLGLRVRRMDRPDPTHDWVQLTLSGLGHTPGYLEQLFDPSAEALVPGLGFSSRLQLDTCRRLLERLGGGIWVCEGAPADLYIRLPLTRLAPSAPLLRAQISWSGKRALVVDDQGETRRTLACWLSEWGFTVVEAANGSEALGFAQQQDLDLVVFDSVLPELDGFELTRQLKAQGLAQGAALVMLASVGQRGDAERCRNLGIDAFLTKPVSPLELRDLLSQVLAPERLTQGRPLITRHLLAEHRPRWRILLIERDPLQQKLACALLKQRGHEPVAVAEGDEALVQLASANYDLVFIDLGLAAEPLIQAINRIASQTHRPLIVGMGTASGDGLATLGLAAQVAKPLTPQVLDDLSRRLGDIQT